MTPISPGSSPHMRGTPADRIRAVSRVGIIPAYAGNTTVHVRVTTVGRDHPRICGEHRGMDTRRETRPGSSPHMRGTRSPAVPAARRPGIIPAYAGNTRVMAVRWLILWDHPRICGEHRPLVMCVERMRGSSPHMRGTRIVPAKRSDLWGIIPAYAGNTMG